ncbi:MAG TPA: tripartite tricarboxylate transporter substrate binding protein [Candidatus Binatia bacterium]|nr:tripartite tricarboxylate transporter substrate binding protein [Candidatus Binatia bacterium]
MIRMIVTLLAYAGLSFPMNVHAQSYPKQAINLLIPLAPGDATDVAGRTIGDGLSKLLKVPVVAINKPGGGGTVGTDSAVKAPKDGYTILITNNASLIYNRILTPETVPYDPFKDLIALGLVARTPIILAVNSNAPFKNFAEMAEYGKKNPGNVRIGTVGPGSVGHFTVEIVNSLTGADMTMIPFKGAGPAVTAALGGHIEGAAAAQGVVAEHLKAGSMRGIVASTKMPEFPQIPTLTQLGYKQNLLGVWSAFFAPAGVSSEVSKTLISALEKVMKDPAVGSRLAHLGMVADHEPPEKLLAEIREEHRSVEQIAKKAGLIK